MHNDAFTACNGHLKLVFVSIEIYHSFIAAMFVYEQVLSLLFYSGVVDILHNFNSEKTYRQNR